MRRKKRSEELLAKVAHKAHSLAADFSGEQKQRVLSAAIPRFCWRTPPDSTIAGMAIESLQRLARMHGRGLTHDPRVPSSGERIMHREAGRIRGKKEMS